MSGLKWFGRFSKAKVLELHKAVVYDDILKKCEIDKKDGSCTFWEHWDSGYIPTRYEYGDFYIRNIDFYDEEWSKVNSRYVEYMARFFGKPYIAALLEYHTRLKADAWLEMLN